MYIPRHFEETRIETLHGLIKSYPFAAFVTLGEGGLLVNHVPMLLDPTAGEFGTLRGHMARANPMWQQFSDNVDSVAIFQGPYSYISPNWYPSKREHGKVVPTWNYAVVHAYGRPRAIQDRAWLLAHVTEMVSVHEASQPAPWKVTDASADFIDGMVSAIAGFEMPIAKLSGKWKVSQNRPAGDRPAIIAALEARGDDQSRAMAALVRQASGG